VVARYYEIDFLPVDSNKSGDAITLRYEVDGLTYIHVIDAGFQDTGPGVVSHIRSHYNYPTYIDHVVATHPDGDHAGGLRSILEEFNVGTLWMFRPWNYAEYLIQRFPTYNSVPRLQARLRTIYSNIAALEEIAVRRGIPMREPFQGQRIGEFHVLAPTIERYFDMVVQSDRTPESEAREAALRPQGLFARALRAATYVLSDWGVEVFPPDGTSAENEMSVVQFATLRGHNILLTGDAGRAALHEAADFAQQNGSVLPSLSTFQVPHHGSRRNVDSDVLDRWLGPRHARRGAETHHAVISASREDEDHPRKAVVRACVHRGGRVLSTANGSIHVHNGAPDRGWLQATPLEYPRDQEQ